MEHSPLPWRVTEAWPEENDHIKIKDNGSLAIKSGIKAIGLFGSAKNPEAAANAALIVRAVNCHEELVSVLRRMVTYYGPGETRAEALFKLENARDILAKAEAQP